MKQKTEKEYDFSPETIEKKRRFPALQIFLLSALVTIQIALLLSIFLYRPEPQDVIEDYTIYATPQADGSLELEYHIRWTALDEDEPLTWVEIGMANEDFTINLAHEDNSSNIARLERCVDDEGYCSLQIFFKQAYHGGDTLDIRFTVNQKWLLARNGDKVFYDFVPGWFNYAETKHYSFHFYKYGDIASYNGDKQDSEWLTWEGSLSYGEYVHMRVNYHSFDAPTVKYEPFDSDGAYDGLADDKASATAFAFILIVITLIGEMFVVDSFVSYHRGRGFLHGYGHPVHIYGRINPHYSSAASQHRGSSGGGRGCACACACACAGGGRAGCSQKDTYHKEELTE